MGATKDSPATEVLEWAVGKLSEASKTDWVEKLRSRASSRPAYLRDGVLAARPAPAALGSVGRAELDVALYRADRAEARADGLARRVAELEQELAGLRPVPAGQAGDAGEEHHKSHWWSRQP